MADTILLCFVESTCIFSISSKYPDASEIQWFTVLEAGKNRLFNWLIILVLMSPLYAEESGVASMIILSRCKVVICIIMLFCSLFYSWQKHSLTEITSSSCRDKKEGIVVTINNHLVFSIVCLFWHECCSSVFVGRVIIISCAVLYLPVHHGQHFRMCIILVFLNWVWYVIICLVFGIHQQWLLNERKITYCRFIEIWGNDNLSGQK